jgi:hypothetical protein
VPDYPEIQALEAFINEHSVSLRIPSDKQAVFDLNPFYISILNAEYLCYIQDEYDDLRLQDPRVHIVLALREFEIIEESTDYLHWCTMMGLPSNSEVMRSYYQDTVNVIPNIKSYFKRNAITSFISDLDYQLNAGAMQYLRNK